MKSISFFRQHNVIFQLISYSHHGGENQLWNIVQGGRVQSKLDPEKFPMVDQCCNEASKIFVLRRFLAEDPSSSSSSVHFKLSKNLRSFEDFRPKIPKIFGIKSLFVEEILKEN